MSSHALLQVYPLEALDAMDEEGGCGVLAIGSPAELESFLEDYRQRHQAAVQAWADWDDLSGDWDAAFDEKHDELCRQHRVNTIIEWYSIAMSRPSAYPDSCRP